MPSKVHFAAMRTLECWLPSFRFVLKSNNLTACSHASEGGFVPGDKLVLFFTDDNKLCKWRKCGQNVNCAVVAANFLAR